MYSARELLVYLSIKCNGDVRSIINALERRPDINDQEVSDVIKTVKSKYITILDKEYPETLKRLQFPPIVLFYYGDVTLLYDMKQCIAVVGSRENSTYGKEMTEKLVKDLCHRYVIVSGLARGIDSIAHQEALKNKGKTIAVLGSGIDYCYPIINKDIYEEIKAKGLLISEYPNDLIPSTENFPNRNRIIAGLANSVLVTEATVQSGTSITVRFALEQGKDVFCVPYRANENSGCNALIRDGAFLVETANDIFEEIDNLK